MVAKIVQAVVGVPVLTLAFCVLSIPATVSLAVAVLAVIVFVRAGPWTTMMVSVSTTITLIMLELVLQVAGSSMIYYRVDEMIGRGDHFVPNVALRGFHQPYGDLYAISNRPLSSIIEPRSVDFITDSLGNRNEHDYNGETLALIGNSLAVGSGTTQSETLAVALSRELGRPVYNASYPGGPIDYLTWRVRFEKNAGKNAKEAKTIFLFFEGKDLPCPDDDWSVVNGTLPWYLDVPNFVKPLATYKIFHALTGRVLVTFARGSLPPSVMVARVGDKDVGFMSLYYKAIRQKVACPWDDVITRYRAFARSTALIAMIPDKSRVYHDFIDPGEDLPDLRWQFIQRLGRETGIPTVNLTPSLVEAARRELPEGRYVYWRDDTHWNGLGMAVAAKAIAAALKEAQPAAVVTAPARPILERARIAGALAGAATPDGWYTSSPNATVQAGGVVGASDSQIYRILPIPAAGREMAAAIQLAGTVDMATILVDVIWQKGGSEVSRETATFNVRESEATTAEVTREVPPGADHILLIVRPWRPEDGKITVGGADISWR